VFEAQDLTDDLFLGGKLKLLQPKTGYRAGTDPVFLAASCDAKAGQSVLELGCGAGTALLCVAARVPIKAVGIERLPHYADLSVQNFERNRIEGHIETADLTSMPSDIREQIFDHVIINPPFFRDGRKAENDGRAAGRQEETPLAEWIDKALRRTKPKGYITLIHLTERLSDILSLINQRTGDIEIKPLSAREGQLPKRVIVRARKGASGVTILHNPLILHTGSSHTRDHDSFTPEAKCILRDGYALLF
jgi:tRNA1Val (adenine37-N6)-methyltransferase